MEQHLHHFIEHFGYIGIMIALAGGIIGLPVPDEVLLTYVGYNVSTGMMSYPLTLTCSFAGALLYRFRLIFRHNNLSDALEYFFWKLRKVL